MTAQRKWRKGPWLIPRCSRLWVTQPCAWSSSKCRRILRHLASKLANFCALLFLSSASRVQITTYPHKYMENWPCFFSFFFVPQPLKESSYCSEDSETHWCWTDSHSLMRDKARCVKNSQNYSGTTCKTLQNFTSSFLAFKLKMILYLVSRRLCVYVMFFKISQLFHCV